MNKMLFSRILFATLLIAFTATGCSIFNRNKNKNGSLPEFDTSMDSAMDVSTDATLDAAYDVPLAAASFNQLPAVSAPADVYPLYFSYNQSVIPTTEMGKLNAVVAFLSANPTVVLVVEGNCDERGTNEFNISLGEFRAQAVRDALISLGINAARIQTVSYGEERPANPNHDETAWAANRRAEFAFYQGS